VTNRKRGKAGGRRKAQPGDADALLQASWAAASKGDLRAARRHLLKAVKARPDDSALRHNLGELNAADGRVDEAAVAFAKALAMDPGLAASAERLAQLLGRFAMDGPEKLPDDGLAAAFEHAHIDLDGIARAAIAKRCREKPLSALLAAGRKHGWPAAARDMLEGPGAPLLADPLLRLALSHGINRDAAVENLLTQVRREILFEQDDARLLAEPLGGFATALVRQCLNTEHALAVSDDERDALASLGEAPAAPLSRALYDPLETLIAGAGGPAVSDALPAGFRTLIAEQRREMAAEAEHAAVIPSLRDLSDATSKRVAAQYEDRPYPRWTSLNIPAPGAMRDTMARFAPAADTGFFDAPFQVLIAGCGTGRQAIQSAHAYGPKAQVLAMDLIPICKNNH